MDPTLRAAALRGDLAALCRALNDGADPRLADEDGDTVLHYAASNGHAQCVALLALNGADVNAWTHRSRTPLSMAAASGRVAAIQALLAAGAEVDRHIHHVVDDILGASTIHASTALHWATSHGTAEAVEALLAAGADVNFETYSLGRTPLDEAVKRYGSFKRPEDEQQGHRLSRDWLRHNRMVPLLVRAGATIMERHAERDSYCKAVRDAGSVRAYERQHLATLVNILNRGTRLPADVIPKIVEYWAHVGWYARRG